MSDNQFPHREGRDVPFDQQGFNQVQRDIDKLFRALNSMLQSRFGLSLSDLTVKGDITVTGNVDGVDVSALKPHALNSTTYHSMTATLDDIFTADASGLPKDSGKGFVTTVGAVGSDSSIPTEQAVREALSTGAGVSGAAAVLAANNSLFWSFFLGAAA